MPLLNWKSQSVGVVSSPHISREAQLTLELSESLALELASSLEEIFEGRSVELRHMLPGGWTLFWKMREGESRALLAHPEAEEWVATLALMESDGRRLVTSLRTGLKQGQALALDDQISFSKVSNLSLRFAAR